MKNAGIVAFSFGVPETIRSNYQIAEIASWRAQEFDLPVYTQHDVRIGPGIRVAYTEEEPDNPPPTLRLARGAVQWAKGIGLTELLVVAAKPHLRRALRDLKKAVREAGAMIEVHYCTEIERYSASSWFCPDSTQDRVRSRWAWYQRELILRFMPFWLYKRVAS